MRTTLRAGLLACLLLSGCESKPAIDPRQVVMDEWFVAAHEILAMLKGVTDKPSYERARPRLRELALKQHALDERLKELGEPSHEELVAWSPRYQEQFQAFHKALSEEFYRLAVSDKESGRFSDALMPRITEDLKGPKP